MKVRSRAEGARFEVGIAVALPLSVDALHLRQKLVRLALIAALKQPPDGKPDDNGGGYADPGIRNGHRSLNSLLKVLALCRRSRLLEPAGHIDLQGQVAARVALETVRDVPAVCDRVEVAAMTAGGRCHRNRLLLPLFGGRGRHQEHESRQDHGGDFTEVSHSVTPP